MPTISDLYQHLDITFPDNIQADEQIQFFYIDSRKIRSGFKGLFIALKSTKRDGHTFIQNAYDKGIRYFLVQQDAALPNLEGAQFIKVDDTLEALQKLAKKHRQQFTLPLIAITGSNGKTIVKEWLYQLLKNDVVIVKSPLSYNSQIGVALSLLMIETHHQLGIFEAGISTTKEMSVLANMIQPNIGFFTNIGEAHSTGFINKRQKIQEKLILFQYTDRLYYCLDHKDINDEIQMQLKMGKFNKCTIRYWSRTDTQAHLYISATQKINGQTKIDGIYNGVEQHIVIPFTDKASIDNAIICWLYLLDLQLGSTIIQDKMQQLTPVAMRLELKQGINDSTLINDTYNSDINSLENSLAYLSQQKQHSYKTVILSDMKEQDIASEDLYRNIAQQLKHYKINRLITIGDSTAAHKHVFQTADLDQLLQFKDTAHFIQTIPEIPFDREAILIKGARPFHFEKIERKLELKQHLTTLTVHLQNIQHNFQVIRSYVQANTKVMAMVKAYSYGSGSYEIASLLAQSGVDYLAVAYTDEGVALRKAGITTPIMVMSSNGTDIDRMVQYHLEPEVYAIDQLKQMLWVLQNYPEQTLGIHIKLDTGMHRLGFEPAQIDTLLQMVNNSTQIEVKSILTHLVGSDDSQYDAFTDQQVAAYQQMVDTIKAQLAYSPICHVCNSAAIVRFPQYHMDMVRAGIMLYGIDTSGEHQSYLLPSATLKTSILQIKYVKAHESIGYNRQQFIERDTRIATIGIGYADGFPRKVAEQHGYVLINGQQAPIVGRVCMDMCMVDITNIPEAQVGDEVEVFGKHLPIQTLSNWADKIPYEIMTGISQRVKRIYENE